MISVLNYGPERVIENAVFFPFDTFNVPFLAGLKVELVRAWKHPTPVVRKGGDDAVDRIQVGYYGSTIKIDNKYHMWYLGGEREDKNRIKNFPGWHMEYVCYATSADGVHWEKPNLGIVEYKGNSNNNIVDLDGIYNGVDAIVVIYDIEDPDPDRKFKMVFESRKYQNRMAVAFSPDGLHWKESKNNPVLPYVFEMSGLVRIGNCYYGNGQGQGPSRILCTVISYDFENWTTACNFGHRRDNINNRYPIADNNLGHQVHLGASLWDRNNTILGFYGIWNGVNQDRRSIIMDLGLLVTSNGVHYHEPVPDFPIVWAEEECDGATPALMQGQGWDNTDEETLYWYGAWREGEVRLAKWKRDRLGYVCVDSNSNIKSPHLLTVPFRIHEGKANVLLNVDGLSNNNNISVELTDERFQSIEGFTASSCKKTANGLRSKIEWNQGMLIPASKTPLRLQINFEGLRVEDIRLYAAYVESVL